MVKRLLKDRFLKDNAVFFVGTVTVAFLNYLYHPVIGRMMKVEDFGEVQAFLSFFMIIGVFTGFFRNVIITVIANDKDGKDKELTDMLRKASLILALVVAGILLLLGNQLATFFNFSSYNYFIAAAALVIIGSMTSNYQAIIQGMNDFKALSFVGILNSLSKLLLSILTISLGWAIFGAIGAIVVASLISLAYSYFHVRKNFQAGNSFKVKIDKRIRRELWYALLFVSVSFSVTFLYSNDVMMVKKYFPAEDAGLYSGIAIVGRIIFFLVSSIPGVLLPAVTLSDKNGENRRVLLKAMGLTALFGCSAFALFSLFPDLTAGILMGERYHDNAHLLPEISAYLLLVSFSNIFL
jgi:O-antigen/teichoic acid export membrane protein